MLRRSASGTPFSDRPKLTFCQTLSQGSSEVSWKIRLRSGDGPVTASPKARSAPPEAGSSPAIR